MDVVNHIRKILRSKHLSIHEVSRRSQPRYGSSSPFFIPHNFYHKIGVRKISPHICQVFSFSKITKYSLVDWLAVFGFRLDEIPRLQMKLHSDHTILITPVTYDKKAVVPWFETVGTSASVDRTVPLSQVIKNLQPRTVRVIESVNRRSFLYVKVGRQDVMAFPELAPGSIVRVDPRQTRVLPFLKSSTRRRPIYLVEHLGGLCCCYVDLVGHNRILLRSHVPPYKGMEFQLSSEAAILGVVDAEIRPLQVVRPALSPIRKAFRGAGLQRGGSTSSSLSNLVRVSRERIGLHFQEAHEMSVEIARELGDPRYEISRSSLSEYETTDTVPRHIHKILSLCILYCMDFWHYLRAARLSLDKAGKDPIPLEAPQWSDKNDAFLSAQPGSIANGPVSDLIKEIEEIPLFLREGFKELISSPELSLRDVYRLGRKQEVLHPLLRGGLFILVNQRMKRIPSWAEKGVSDRSLHLVLTRKGDYLCGFCSLQDDILTVHPHSEINAGVKRFHHQQDAEVIGQVVAVIRRISGTPMADS